MPFSGTAAKPWSVTDLFVVPGHFLTPAVIEKRPPLKDTARAEDGWAPTSCLGVWLQRHGSLWSVRATFGRQAEARDAWQRFAFLGTAPEARGGWGADVLTCVRTLVAELGEPEFTLQQFYHRFEAELQRRHPGNQNVQPKIRQQMQVLRDGGVLDFLDPGRYRIRH